MIGVSFRGAEMAPFVLGKNIRGDLMAGHSTGFLFLQQAFHFFLQVRNTTGSFSSHVYESEEKKSYKHGIQQAFFLHIFLHINRKKIRNGFVYEQKKTFAKV